MPTVSDLIISLTPSAEPADRTAAIDHLQQLAGVEKVYLDPHQTWVLVTFQAAVTSTEQILQGLADCGYAAASVRLFDSGSDA